MGKQKLILHEMYRVKLADPESAEVVGGILRDLFHHRSIGFPGWKMEGEYLLILDLYTVSKLSFINRLRHFSRKWMAACGYRYLHLVVPSPANDKFSALSAVRAFFHLFILPPFM